MPPPESSIFVGDHIMRLVLIKFIVERHLIQETIYLPTCRKKNPGTHLPKGRVRGSHICLSALLARLRMCRLSSFLQTHHCDSSWNRLCTPCQIFTILKTQLKAPHAPQTATSPEHYGPYYLNDIYYKLPGFISYLFLISMLLFQSDIKEL